MIVGAGAWEGACIILFVGIGFTVVPILLAFLRRVRLEDAVPWFEGATQLRGQQQRLQDHYARIRGTLVYWKNQATAHHRVHLSRVLWSLLSSALLPVLIQFYEPQKPAAVVFMTILPLWTGLLVIIALTFRSEEQYQGFRRQESDYYDLSRQLLDTPSDDDDELRQQVDSYISTVEEIRKMARKVETGGPPSALEARGPLRLPPPGTG